MPVHGPVVCRGRRRRRLRRHVAPKVVDGARASSTSSQYHRPPRSGSPRIDLGHTDSSMNQFVCPRRSFGTSRTRRRIPRRRGRRGPRRSNRSPCDTSTNHRVAIVAVLQVTGRQWSPCSRTGRSRRTRCSLAVHHRPVVEAIKHAPALRQSSGAVPRPPFVPVLVLVRTHHLRRGRRRAPARRSDTSSAWRSSLACGSSPTSSMHWQSF